jgi:hypothetical protein
MFTQEIRWSRPALGALACLYLWVLLAIVGPALFLPPLRDATVLLLLIAALTTVFFAGLTAIFTTLRITIDQHTLTVGFGPFCDRVPLEAITACEPTTYRWIEWGGWGIRCGWRRKLYHVPGDRGRAVQLTLSDGRRLLFSSPDPTAVCRALWEHHPVVRRL